MGGRNAFIAISLLTILATPALAQETGTIIQHRAAQIDTITENNKVAARQTMRQLTQCLASRTSGRVDRMLSLPVDSPEYARMTKNMFDREDEICLSGGGIQFPIEVMRGSLFEAVYVRDFKSKPAASLATLPPLDYAMGYGASPSGYGAQAIALARFGDCVTRADEGSARSLILSIPGSPGEAGLFNMLLPRFSACLPKGVEFRFSKTLLRGGIAEGLYRLSKTVPSK